MVDFCDERISTVTSKQADRRLAMVTSREITLVYRLPNMKAQVADFHKKSARRVSGMYARTDRDSTAEQVVSV